MIVLSDELKRIARQPFFSLHMDGRNEHGTHLLPLNQTSIDDIWYAEIVNEFLDDTKGEFPESVFRQAELLGYRTGDAIVTVWRWQHDETHYLEYDHVSPVLTELFFGTPDEQHSLMEKDHD
jgi:hypothetical protein